MGRPKKVEDLKEEVIRENPEEKTEVEKMPKEEKPKEKRVKIIIEEQEGEENQGAVFVSVNGFAYSIKRGFEVEVPESVVEVLNNSVMTKMFQNVETGEITYKDVPRYNYRILR